MAALNGERFAYGLLNNELASQTEIESILELKGSGRLELHHITPDRIVLSGIEDRAWDQLRRRNRDDLVRE